MPSTFSTNLKLELMATGEKNNTWGDVTNTNLGTLIEQAIVGGATVVMGDANQTLTIPDGATSDGRCVYITCTGGLTANRTLTVPTLRKNYMVENATTGGFNITVKTSGGTGVAIAPDQTRAVYADATNVVEQFNSMGTINNVSITQPASTATLAIASAKTLTVSNTLTLAGTDGTTIDFSTLVPPGMIMPYGGASSPSGWLLCDGSAVSRVTYATLFLVIDVTFGSGDGTTTFNVPDLRGRVPAGRDDMGGAAANRLNTFTMSPDANTVGANGGSQTVSLTAAQNGSHSHTPIPGGVVALANTGALFVNAVGGGSSYIGFSGSSTGTSGSGNAHSNTQPSMIFNYLIKT